MQLVMEPMDRLVGIQREGGERGVWGIFTASTEEPSGQGRLMHREAPDGYVWQWLTTGGQLPTSASYTCSSSIFAPGRHL